MRSHIQLSVAVLGNALYLFDRIVLENGSILYYPATRKEKLLGDRSPETFIKALHEKNVNPLSVGRVIVATGCPHDT
ncbi:MULTISPECIES: hypothetical protein [Aerosakkonema]|uniref:hypothetical protein n=1 Tax=Aerosakkonema TaxID=1246629 RepID=UPI0035B73989